MGQGAEKLAQRIKSREAKIGIVGLGYVGLPLAVEFALGGFEVHGIDNNDAVAKQLAEGRSHVLDVKDETLREVLGKRLFIHPDYEMVAGLDCVSICVPTPLRKTRDPDISYILSAAEGIRDQLHAGMLLVLESTTFPGTTEEILVPEILKSDLKVGEDVFVAFSPERVDPGNREWTTKNTPKIVGGVTSDCTDLACTLYSQVIDRVIPVSSPATAEMVKLLENTFRAVNIGLVNEITIMCERLGLSVWEVIEAAATKPFGFMPFKPGPGLGGHCIPIDPLYLSWKLKTLNYNARFIELATEVNASMPEYCVFKVAKALNARGKPVKGSRILILGVAYKRDVSDTRESPALDIMRLLEVDGAQVDYADPFVPHLALDGGQRQSVELSPEGVAEYDVVILTTDHSSFDYPMIRNSAGLIFDTRNAWAGEAPNILRL